MDKEIKISEEEYSQLEEEANKLLEILNSETVDELRKKVHEKLNGIITLLETKSKTSREKITEFSHANYNPSKDNPFRTAKRSYWLTQIANFISVAVFKVPRELTPTVGYPYESIRMAGEFDKHASKVDNELMSIFRNANAVFENSLKYFYEIDKNILEDDTKLMIFCDSCNNIDRIDYKVKTAPNFKEVASLVYQNGISISPGLYDRDVKVDSFTSKITQIIGDVGGIYDKIKEENKQKQY